MAFSVNNWVKCWEEPEKREKFTKVRLSSSRKDKQTGEYVTDWSGFASLVGRAHAHADEIQKGTRFKILECAVTSKYDKEAQKEFINYTIFDFSVEDSVSDNVTVHEIEKKSEKPKSALDAVIDDDKESADDDELPF